MEINIIKYILKKYIETYGDDLFKKSLKEIKENQEKNQTNQINQTEEQNVIVLSLLPISAPPRQAASSSAV
ncbi:MAG: hypothetical protein K2I76_02685, partial [Malacoplasma sp.]|nr:hypothetical protein [Malacoplasma sp.]